MLGALQKALCDTDAPIPPEGRDRQEAEDDSSEKCGTAAFSVRIKEWCCLTECSHPPVLKCLVGSQLKNKMETSEKTLVFHLIHHIQNTFQHVTF